MPRVMREVEKTTFLEIQNTNFDFGKFCQKLRLQESKTDRISCHHLRIAGLKISVTKGTNGGQISIRHF